jgi:hypothetical protein
MLMARVETKSFALTRMCLVKGSLCDPKGVGAFIPKLPVNQIEPCPECEGTGKDTVCRSCKHEAKPGERFIQGRIVTCSTCNGTAKVEGQACYYCKGTKRFYPPHHYVEVDSDGDLVIEEEDDENEEIINGLREQIKELNGDYDGRWGATRLEQELVILKKTKGV